MKTRPRILLCFISAGMLALILDSKTALSGGQEGIRLIIQTVIPSLFPFFFLSIALANQPQTGKQTLLKPIGRLLNFPENMEHLLIPAFMGGYPAGAQAIATAWQQGHLDRNTAQRLLAYCSNAGPSFLFGIVGPFFSDGKVPWIIWFLLFSGAVFTCHVLPPVGETYAANRVQTEQTSPDILKAAIRVTGTICGWLLLFRIVISFLERWFLRFLPKNIYVWICGLLELTNGCCMLDQISDERIAFLMAATMLSLGGFCVLLQTASVTDGLSLRWYLSGKLFQTTWVFFIGYAMVYRKLFPALIPFILAALSKRIPQKRSSIPSAAGV